MQKQEFIFQEEPQRQQTPHNLASELIQSEGVFMVHLQNQFSPEKAEHHLNRFDSNDSEHSNNQESEKRPQLEFQQQHLSVSSVQQPSQMINNLEYQKEWIMKEANMERIGGTLDFFAHQIEKYRRHIQARKSVLESIYTSLNKNKASKGNIIVVLKQYFKDYSSLCTDFHQRSYKYQLPQRNDTENKVVNMRSELRSGFQRLLSLRKDVGNKHSLLDKFISSNTIKQIQKAIQAFWGATGQAEAKLKSKKQNFQQKFQKLQKRIDKITKVYNKGRYGEEGSDDMFIQMTKFVKEERDVRCTIFDWGKEIISLRKTIINSEYSLMVQLEGILTEYKNFNDSIFQLKNKKYNFSEKIKQQIEKQYLYENLCFPVDNDYILGILNYKKKKNATLVTQTNYQQFLNEEYFSIIIGNTTELLKGTIIKSFPLKNPQEELVRSISENFILYNKKTLEIKNKLILANTEAEFTGQCCVTLRQKVKGIIFDSQNIQSVIFSSDDRAEELVMSFNMEFGKQ